MVFGGFYRHHWSGVNREMHHVRAKKKEKGDGRSFRTGEVAIPGGQIANAT